MEMGPVWKTKDGREIPVTQMDPAHLWNAWRFVDRRIVAYNEALDFTYDPVFGLRGEMALYYAEQELEEMGNLLPTLLSWRHILEKELKRRDIKFQRAVKRELPRARSVTVGPHGYGTIIELEPPQEGRRKHARPR
jgi:hypothetical protein